MKKIKKILGILFLVLTLTVPVTIISETTTVETQAATPKIITPKLVSAKSYGTSKIKFTWKRVSGVNGYTIYRKTDKSSWKKIKTIANNKTSSYTDSKLNPGTRYFYSIRAYKKVGQKNVYSSYNKKGVWAVTSIPKLKIKNIYLYKPEYSVHMTWTDYRYATGFEVYRKSHNEVKWVKIATQKGNNFSIYDENIQDGMTYDYKVRAYSSYSGKIYRGPFSDVKSFTIEDTSVDQDNNPIQKESPNFDVFMSSKAKPNATTASMLVENHGSKTLRIYARYARLIDSEYSEFNRNLIMVDPDEINNDRLVKISYIDILPGSESFVPFLVKDDSTWYDGRSTIFYEFRYDGVDYWAHSSSYYGTEYYKS